VVVEGAVVVVHKVFELPCCQDRVLGFVRLGGALAIVVIDERNENLLLGLGKIVGVVQLGGEVHRTRVDSLEVESALSRLGGRTHQLAGQLLQVHL